LRKHSAFTRVTQNTASSVRRTEVKLNRELHNPIDQHCYSHAQPSNSSAHLPIATLPLLLQAW
jgi:hypothetical protein